MSQAHSIGPEVPDFLTTQEVAKRLRVSVNSVHRLAESGALPSVKVGRLRRFDPAKVAAYLEQPTPNADVSPLRTA